MTQLSVTHVGIEYKGHSPLLLLFSEKIKKSEFQSRCGGDGVLILKKRGKAISD